VDFQKTNTMLTSQFLTMGFDAVPVEAHPRAERLPTLFTPKVNQLFDVVLLGVVVLELQPSFKLNVARFAPEPFQVRVPVVPQVRDHETANFTLLSVVVLRFVLVLLQSEHKMET
jgi:hypothetical protein